MAGVRSRLEDLLLGHAAYSWTKDATELLSRLPIAIGPAAGAHDAKSGLYIPDDMPLDASRDFRATDCFGIEMVLLHPFELEEFPGFEPVSGTPWLWRNGHGALMLAFNLQGFIDRFVDLGEERDVTARDAHGRLPSEASTLRQLGVLHRPLLNTYFFAILAIAKAQGLHSAAADPREYVLPPVLVLSHDCDQLRGNDIYTQLVRLFRFVEPLRRLKPPAFRILRHIVENALFPRRHFFDDALAMARLEARHGFRSAWYFLNGMGGRLGARSGSPIIAEFARHLPPDAELGVHYNYRYAADPARLADQIAELSSLTGRPIMSGRAHYLAFDPCRDFETLAHVGVTTDESLGFSNLNSFRVGFAGAYLAGDPDNRIGTRVVEIPLQFMDTNTVPDGGEHDLLRMVRPVEQVGGVITLLFHPGSFDTPEAPQLRGLYERYLAHFAERGYRSMLPSELGVLVRSA